MTRRTTAALLLAALALACRDPATAPELRLADPSECAPGLRCAAGEACSSGRCVTTCGEPLATCDVAGARRCVDTRHDPAHCGGCGLACGTGEVCGPDGCAAACADPLTTCRGADGAFCADTQHDPAHCGGCGQACGAGLACEAGRCALRCASPLTACGAGPTARCVDLLEDRSHCGACGIACGGSAACVRGQCVAAACRGPIGLPDLPIADAGARAVAVAAADLDGDGRLDLATAGYDDRVVSVVLGDGAGRFGPPRQLPIPQVPVPRYARAVAAARLDGDARADLVVAAQRPYPEHQDVVVLVVLDPAGEARIVESIPVTGPAALAVADLDGDGRADLILGTATGLEVRRGAGDGTFLEPVAYAQSAGANLVAVADLDGDGDLDVASASWPGEGVAVLRNEGTGALPEAVRLETSWSVVDLAAGDADGDGTADLAVHLYDGGNAVAFGPDLAGFARISPATSGWSASVLLADVDGDGRAELLAGDYGTGLLETWRLDEAGLFVPGPRVPAGTGTDGLEAADVDGDGRVEVLIALGYGRGTAVQRWEDGRFPGPAAAPFARAPGFEAEVLLVDLDGDGALDLVGAGGGEFDPLVLMVAWGRGDATFEPALELPGVAYPHGIAAGDVDGDGRPDLAVVGAQPRLLSVTRGQGARRFGPPAEVALPEGPLFVALGDLDGDGRDDAVVGLAGDQLALLRAGPDGLEPPVYLTTGVAPSDGALADLDGDGRLDLAVAAKGAVHLHRATGPLAFAQPQVRPVPCEYVGSIAVGDLDGNRWPDLVVACPFAEVRAIRDPGREEAAPVAVAAGAYSDVTTGDVDGDGLDDVVFAAYPDGLGLARNLGGRFAPAERFPARGWTRGVAAGDLDRDGRADAASNQGVYRTTCGP